MYRLVAHTQDWEDYGYRWKPKGGSDYLVAELTLAEVLSLGQKGMLAKVRDFDQLLQETFKGGGFKSQVIDWGAYAPGELTDFERAQLEYDGKVTYPARPLQTTH